MDNRRSVRSEGPGPQRAGHAFYADQARRALGLGGALQQRLPDVPAPVFNALVGAAVALAAVLARPQAVGTRPGAILDGALAAVAGMALIYHDRVVCPPGVRPGAEAAVLPAAAMLGLAVSLAGTSDVRVGAVAIAVAALVIAGAPHLNSLRKAGREGPVLRLVREAAGIVVLLPVLLAAAAPSLTTGARAGLVAGATAAVGFDALRTDRVPVRRTLLATALLALLCAAAVPLAARSTAQTAVGAALLVLWYGLRGVAGQAAAREAERGALVEYAAFAVGAAAALGVLATR